MEKATVAQLQRKVKKGIIWLNEVKPGWYKEIDVETLRMDNRYSCVCGQLFTNFWKVIYNRGGDMKKRGEARKTKKIAMSYEDSIKRGFCAEDNFEEYVFDMLTKIWYLEILKLRESK